MAKWVYDVVQANNASHLSQQLNDMARDGWEPILYEFATAPPSGGQSHIKELHYVVIRRQPEQAEAGVTFAGEREKA